MKRRIRLRGLNGPVKGKVWENTGLLRVGRLESLEIVLNDASVSRTHAEIRSTERGWRVCDLGSTNGTHLNGVRLGNGQWPLRVRDLVQFGEVATVVEILEDAAELEDTANSEQLRVETTARSSWEEALQGIATNFNSCPRPGDQLVALLRAGHHLVHLESEEELLQSILNDAVAVLDAQRGAIVLADEPGGQLRLRALATGRGSARALVGGHTEPATRHCFSQSVAQRSFSGG